MSSAFNLSEYRKQKVSDGICYACSNPIIPGTTYCVEHRDKATKRSKEVYLARKALGICVVCGVNPPSSDRVMCRECVEYRNAHRNKEKAHETNNARKEIRISHSLCIKCGQPAVPGMRHCEKHRKENCERTTNHNRNCREQGICPYCGNAAIPGRVLCEAHRKISIDRRRRLKYDGNWNKVIERDNGKCQICGMTEKLNVHHIDGRGDGSKFPNHSIDNLITLCSACHTNLTYLLRKSMDHKLVCDLILRYSNSVPIARK